MGKPYFIHIPKTAGTTIVNQAIKHGHYWGEYDDFFQEQPFKHHQPLQWYIDKGDYSVQRLISEYELFTILRNPVERFVSDLKWHIERRPSTLIAFGYTRREVQKDVRPLLHNILDIVEEINLDRFRPNESRFLSFRLKRLIQKRDIELFQLRKFGHAHFIPQFAFCTYKEKEIISKYFFSENLAELGEFLNSRGIEVELSNRKNKSKLKIVLDDPEIHRIRSVYAESIKFYESKKQKDLNET